MDNLAKHKKIAFDLDGTLIDGKGSPSLASFIAKHPDKSYFIVTFRTPRQSASIPTELSQVGLSADLFDRIVPMPERLLLDFDEDQQYRRNAAMPAIADVPPEALLPGEFKLMHWKGFIAKKLGATVLVDDLPWLVTLGCAKFGVEFVDAGRLSVQESSDRTKRYRRRMVPALPYFHASTMLRPSNF